MTYIALLVTFVPQFSQILRGVKAPFSSLIDIMVIFTIVKINLYITNKKIISFYFVNCKNNIYLSDFLTKTKQNEIN